jgi:dihydroxyacid dehydratase/phosphogluconate dehydratase
VFATFAPAHVLKGGTIPAETRAEILELAGRAELAGMHELADDLREGLEYILQCYSNEMFLAFFERAVQANLISAETHKRLEKSLAVNACDARGGICAFHGTGNSSRDVVAALGLVHPQVEMLIEPPNQAQVNAAVDALLEIADDPRFAVNNIVAQNIANAVRVHAAVGGSTNLMMHMVAAMRYAGYAFSVYDIENITRIAPIPDIYDYSLTQGRDVFALAQQCCAGQIRGMETVFYELTRNGVPLDLDAPTVTGQTWRQRLSDTRNLSADGVRANPVILSTPRRAISGTDVLRGNWFETAVVKISGLPDELLDMFDDKVALVMYFETEEDANAALVDAALLEKFYSELQSLLRADELTRVLRHMHAFNSKQSADDLADDALFDAMVRAHTLRVAVVIAGQGPEAFGMPEMAVPSFRINYHRVWRQLVSLITDGRYSGTNFGVSVGHVTPEAIRGGGILYLQNGDLVHLQFRKGRIDLLRRDVFAQRGAPEGCDADWMHVRAAVGAERQRSLELRARQIAPSNRMVHHTDAAHGVVPQAVAEWAIERAALTLTATR